MFCFTPIIFFYKIGLLPSPSLRGVIADEAIQNGKTCTILDCFAPLAMTIFGIILLCVSLPAFAATSIPFTINLSENVTVTGSPRIAVDVGGVTRYATYASGSGTSALTFTYAMVAGDVDLDGVTVSSPIQPNGGTIKDASGNDATLTFTPPNTTNVKVNYPSLGMDFVADADGRYTLNGTPYNDLPAFLTATGGSFTRASIGTYFDSAGVLQTAASGVPRFDYDPVTHAAKGMLIEDQKTNLLTYSANIGGSNWNSGGAVTVSTNASTAPDGSLTATTITTSGGGNYVINGASWTSGLTYTMSFYYRCLIGSCGTGFTHGFFDNGGGTLLQATTASPTSVWQRASLAFTPTSTTSGQIRVFTNTSIGTGTLAIWGAQLEQGSVPTSYIPTTTAAVTRQADVLSVPTAGWINSAESTLYSEGEYGGLGNARGIASLGSSFASNFQPTKEGDLAFRIYLNGTQIFQDLAISAFSNNKFAFGLKSGQYAYVKNGGTVSTSANAAVATNQNTMISDGGFYHTKKLKYYPLRITNTQLQLMTQ